MAAPSFLEEIRKTPDSVLSQPAQANVIFQIKYTLHPALLGDYYHFDVVRKKLTHALPRILPNLVDETRYGFGIEVGSRTDWADIQVYPMISKLITRISNRMMVGLELCRNDEFLYYSGAYTKATFDAAAMLRSVPEFLKPAIMYFMTDHKKQQQTARRYLVPVIKKRLQVIQKAEVAGKTEELKGKTPDDACKKQCMSPALCIPNKNE